MSHPKQQHLGVFIPQKVIDDQTLSWQDRALLVTLDYLDDGTGCFASNGYLAARIGVSERTLVRMVSDLRDKGYIIDRGFNGRVNLRSVKYSARGFTEVQETWSPSQDKTDQSAKPNLTRQPSQECPAKPEMTEQPRQDCLGSLPKNGVRNRTVKIKTISSADASASKEAFLVASSLQGIWKDSQGGEIPVARLLRAFKGILKELPSEGVEDFKSAWTNYLGSTDKRYTSPEAFATKWKTFIPSAGQTARADDPHSD